ncbi:MAG TPA: transcription termination factor Rho [Nocardioides sp.]|uniref:transcription termination factor Rho n=1 Tax=Nocardioides sp. TaxID=35761 RepID=UPI002ED9F269
MTETTDSTTAAAAATGAKKRGGGLNSLLLADLKAMAAGMGIAGAGSMKKAQLVEAIKAAQSAQAGNRSQPRSEAAGKGDSAGAKPARKRAARAEQAQPGVQPGAQAEQSERTEQSERAERSGQPDRADRADGADRADAADVSRAEDAEERRGQRGQGGRQGNQRGNQQGEQRGEQPAQEGKQGQQPQDGKQNQQNQQGQQGQQGQQVGDGDGADGESRRSRRRRGRDRDRPRATGGAPRERGDVDIEIREDDVLVPAAGILDVLDNYAFVRTSGYLPGADDVYVSMSLVRRLGLRRGDAITGQVRQPREGERKEKFNPMVRIDSVNGADPATATTRVEFSKLTPLYATERLRMETGPDNMIGRVIDIAAPIGKGQRGLIVSPAKAGKTMVMQSIANSITANNPECHLMVVLVDERPEEVTDFERSVKGEVISSTFDRPATDHTIVAELAIERAKRLVELGHDVVVLLDGITRLGRAYNLAAPASGRILSGGVDSAALYPPKKFFGAARNIENGGSLTILATALIESGSKMDEVIFEEFKGTGNMEIRLRRDFAEKRLFPAIDVVQSGTRREELLLSPEELAIIWKLRKVLSGLDGQQALELLLERLRKAQSNIEFLMQVQKTTPAADEA